MGKLIVIEGTDASGKETQTNKLYERLKDSGKEIKKISFPNYDSPACAPVKMYLAGEFGTDPLKIDPYPISTMYAIDRYASFIKEWGQFYNDGGIIITDRYVTSNMIHQASKIFDPKEKHEYLNWLEDLEYSKFHIPRPDMVIFLNMPTFMAKKLMEERKNKITGEKVKDIHERDLEYLEDSYKNACEISRSYNWTEIHCLDHDRLKTIDNISDEIFDIVNRSL